MASKLAESDVITGSNCAATCAIPFWPSSSNHAKFYGSALYALVRDLEFNRLRFVSPLLGCTFFTADPGLRPLVCCVKYANTMRDILGPMHCAPWFNAVNRETGLKRGFPTLKLIPTIENEGYYSKFSLTYC